MTADTNVQADYKQGISSDASANAGKQAAQNSQSLAPQQPNESAEAYAKRQNAYNQAKGEQK